ncbi:MAG: hypothetical protein PHY47_27485 [Lachnospiraceae bacterium]|nr:hypothetical protein [Lachnospiraceae bacterium]
MIELFNEYKNTGKMSEALLVGRNMVNRNPSNLEMFRAYMDLLISLSELLPSLTDRKNFIGQANVTLAFFEENAEMTADIVSELNEYREKIDPIAKQINKEEMDRNRAALREVQANNGKAIKALYAQKQKLSQVKSQSEFDAELLEISKIDAQIEHDYMTDEQKAHYDQINKECTTSISDKMREMEHTNNVAYNKKAVDAYDSAFKKFKNDESKYKGNQTQLFSLVSSTLFAYDAARLFNESLIYYNHVYSFIFSKLDDDGKLALTRFSIECERKKR